MARVIKLQNGTDTLLPISDATAIQMTVDNNTKSVQDVILENEEIFAAAMTDLNSQMEDISYQLENMPDAIDESTVAGWGFTKNPGTITGINMNGASKGTSGIVDLGTVITSETQLSKGTTTGSGNAVTDISVSNHQITLTKGKTFLESFTETDPTVPSYVKGITESDITNWNNKQDALVSGTNIKTIDNTSILGSGNINTINTFSGSATGNEYSTQKRATIDNYTLRNGNIISLYFSARVRADSTINISSTGAKNIIYNNVNITDGIINGGDTATFVYDTSINGYVLLSVDNGIRNYCPIIEDARSGAVPAITGVAPFSTLVDGQRIILKLKYSTASASSNNPSLNLTLNNNTTTGAKSLWFYRNSSVLQVGASNFQIGVPNGQVAYISMIYNSDNDCWYCDYNYWYYNVPGILTQTDLNTGTATASKTITAKLLRDNFYLKSETAGITNLGETDDFTITL